VDCRRTSPAGGTDLSDKPWETPPASSHVPSLVLRKRSAGLSGERVTSAWDDVGEVPAAIAEDALALGLAAAAAR
jgi:hypothetical protein